MPQCGLENSKLGLLDSVYHHNYGEMIKAIGVVVCCYCYLYIDFEAVLSVLRSPIKSEDQSLAKVSTYNTKYNKKNNNTTTTHSFRTKVIQEKHITTLLQ